jgi:hypothetical protein
MKAPIPVSSHTPSKDTDYSSKDDDRFPRNQSQIYIFVAVAFASLTILRILIWVFAK